MKLKIIISRSLFFFNLQFSLLTLYICWALFFGFRYHEASDKARSKVLELLRGLSSELQDKINILVFSSMLLIISKALFSHVRWSLLCPACGAFCITLFLLSFSKETIKKYIYKKYVVDIILHYLFSLAQYLSNSLANMLSIL